MGSLKAGKMNTIATSRRTTAGSRAGGAKGRVSLSKSSTRAATRMRPIELAFSPRTPQSVLRDLRRRYARWLEPPSADEALVDVFKTAEWKDFESRQTPGAWLAGLRQAHALTQRRLGSKLGVAAARVSDWEHDRRAISKRFAKILARMFKVPVERFL